MLSPEVQQPLAELMSINLLLYLTMRKVESFYWNLQEAQTILIRIKNSYQKLTADRVIVTIDASEGKC